jgi:hypothetical protein
LAEYDNASALVLSTEFVRLNIAFVEGFRALLGSFAAPQGEVLSESIEP